MSRITLSDLWVVVPVRSIPEGKSRLAGVLDPEARTRLNRQLLERTLRAVADWCGDLSCCAVATSCHEAGALAARSGAVVVEEAGEGQGLNAAAALGMVHARNRGAKSVLVLACDLPCVNADALAAMLDAASPRLDMVIAPDRHGTGTNALLTTALTSFEFRFGEKSCAEHLALAAERGWRATLCRRPELEFDLDTPEDLARWRECSRKRSSTG